jgi:NitT/TauT family transport system permease protein
VVVVAAEMIGMKSGLGFLVVSGRDALRLDRVAAAMIVIGVIGLILDRIMQGLGQMESVRWKIAQK